MTPPVISGCPPRNIKKLFLNPSGSEGFVLWDEPTATDDDGQPVQVRRTHMPAIFLTSGRTTVQYFFTDSNDNEAVCTFFIDMGSGRNFVVEGLLTKSVFLR